MNWDVVDNPTAAQKVYIKMLTYLTPVCRSLCFKEVLPKIVLAVVYCNTVAMKSKAYCSFDAFSTVQ